MQPLLGMSISGAIVLLLVFLYRYEARRGTRLYASLRVHIDFWILKMDHLFQKFFKRASRDIIRQVLHYFFHSIFSFVLMLLERIERGIKEVLRSNRSLARKSHRERTTRNKLEEIALHKMEVALSEEEKRKHKEKHLNG